MIVLVGPNSASAAEIVAGALQLHDRAVIIGKKTFGKGSVQIFRTLLDDSSLKYTTQEYQFKDGQSIQGQGVIPDISFTNHNVSEDGTVDLIPYTSRSEGDDEFALASKSAYQQQTFLHLHWVRAYRSLEDMRRHQLSAEQFEPDQAALMTLEMFSEALSGADVPARFLEAKKIGEQRQFVLSRLRDPVVKRQAIESQKLADVLLNAPQSVVWGASREPADVSFVYTGPTAVEAGQTYDFSFEVTNSGNSAIGALYALVAADTSSPFWEEELPVGLVEAGATKTVTLRFALPPRLHAGTERFTVELHQLSSVETLASVDISLQVQAQPRPRFGYRWELIEAAGGNGQVDLDEDVIVRLHISNDGTGAMEAARLYVIKDDDHHVQLGEGRWKLDGLAAGESIVCDVPIRVLSEVRSGQRVHTFNGDHVTLQIRGEERFDDDVDSRYRSSFYHALEIPIGAAWEAGQIRKPSVSLVSQSQTGNVLHLEVALADENLKYVSAFRDADKVDLRLVSEPGTHRFAIQLEPGLNTIRVLGTDADKTSEAVVVRCWGTEGV